MATPASRNDGHSIRFLHTRFRAYTKRKTSGQMRREVLVVYSANQMKTRARKKEWFDDDSFWRELYPFMFSKERIAGAEKQIAKALALTKPAGNAVLDLCCGPGRCSIAL